MRAFRFVIVGALALAATACTASTAVLPPEASGFSGYDREADRAFRMPSQDAWFYQAGNTNSAVQHRSAGKKHADGAVRKDKHHDRVVYSRERVVHATPDRWEAYRRATLQGDTYHGDSNVPDTYGREMFHHPSTASHR